MKITLNNPASNINYLSETFNSKKLNEFAYAMRVFTSTLSFTTLLINYANQEYRTFFNYSDKKFTGIRIYPEGYSFYFDASDIKEITIYKIKIR